MRSEGELATLTAAMVNTDAAIARILSAPPAPDADGEQVLLRDITGLAARIEKLSLDNSYRFFRVPGIFPAGACAH